MANSAISMYTKQYTVDGTPHRSTSYSFWAVSMPLGRAQATTSYRNGSLQSVACIRFHWPLVPPPAHVVAEFVKATPLFASLKFRFEPGPRSESISETSRASLVSLVPLLCCAYAHAFPLDR